MMPRFDQRISQRQLLLGRHWRRFALELIENYPRKFAGGILAHYRGRRR